LKASENVHLPLLSLYSSFLNSLFLYFMPNFSSLPLPATLVRTLLAIFFICLRLPATAQAPVWQSAQTVAVATAAATGISSIVTATAVDATGNVFLAGYFRNSVVLGSTTLTSLGNYDVFVAKFNPTSKQFVWAQRAGGTGSDYINALAVSGTSVYIAGRFDSPTAGFGAVTLTNTSAAPNSDAFVVKLTDAGSTSSFVWAQRAGGLAVDLASALAVSGTSVYVAGAFTNTAAFGTTTLTSAGSYDVFVAKLIDAGPTSSFVWTQRAGDRDSDQPSALAVSGTSVYVAGNFTYTPAFGSTTLSSAGFSDAFVAKLTDAGSTSSFVWAQRAGGTGYEYVHGLAVSGTSVYIAGRFDSPTVDFGSTTMTNAGSTDAFVAKLTDMGATSNLVWAQRIGGTSDDIAEALAVSGTSIFVAGAFSNTATFGSTTLTSAGTTDAFVAKLTDAGPTSSFVWAQRAGGTSGDGSGGLAVGGASVYVAGSFSSSAAVFNPITLTNPTPNADLGFLAVIADPTLTAVSAAQAGSSATLFPNPASGTATLSLPTGAAPSSLTLTDAQGRAIRDYPATTGSKAALDLQGLPPGLYLLRGAGLAHRLVVE
jgi:hypothetical protein